MHVDGLGMFLEPVAGEADALDLAETIRIVEDYKPLDIECAAMTLALCRGIRARYPEWRHLIDGDGGDENLKDSRNRRPGVDGSAGCAGRGRRVMCGGHTGGSSRR